MTFVKGQSGNPEGRAKGSLNKFTELKEMFLSALNSLGGEKFIKESAQKDPIGFLRIVGKMLPQQIRGDLMGAVPIIVKFETVKAEETPTEAAQKQGGHQPSHGGLDASDPPQGGTGMPKPNPDIKPPPYDRVTEGYDPSKVEKQRE